MSAIDTVGHIVGSFLEAVFGGRGCIGVLVALALVVGVAWIGLVMFGVTSAPWWWFL